jgi:cysteine synthase A
VWERGPELFLQNRSNFDAHFTGTGPEIWRQTNGEIVGFVAGAGQSTVVPSPATV